MRDLRGYLPKSDRTIMLPRVPLYSVVVNIMKFYRHDRDSNPDRCGENQTC